MINKPNIPWEYFVPIYGTIKLGKLRKISPNDPRAIVSSYSTAIGILLGLSITINFITNHLENRRIKEYQQNIIKEGLEKEVRNYRY